MRKIGWEEAMRAWRVVQSTVFACLCDRDTYKLRKNHESIQYKWFEPASLISNVSGSRYHAGSYLKIVNGFLIAVAIFAVIPMAVAAIQFFVDDKIFFGIISVIVTLIMFLIVLEEKEVLDNRRKLLEAGLLSIHSCAIIWQAVVVAHYRAVNKASRNPRNLEFDYYTLYVANEAKNLAQHVFHIHSWVNTHDCPTAGGIPVMISQPHSRLPRVYNKLIKQIRTIIHGSNETD